MQTKVLSNPKITIVYDTVIDKLHGGDKLEKITIKNIKTNDLTDLEVDGLFYGLGLTPNTQLFANKLKMDSEGYIVKVPKGPTESVIKNSRGPLETMTSIEGVFVCGDSNDKIYRQAVVAAGDGCKAAIDVNNYLNGC